MRPQEDDEMVDETICKQDKIAVTVFVDTVKIEITCASDYEAQVLFDDLVARFQAGEPITIEPCGERPAVKRS